MKSFNRIILLQLAMICTILLQDVCGKSSTLILRNANYNRNSLVKGKLVSVLEGNVIFRYDKAIIRSDHATWYRRRGIAHFKGNVRITQENQLLTCKRLKFNRNQKKITAYDNLDFYDKVEMMRIIAQRGIYFFETGNLILTQNPQMFQYDTARAETLSISGDKMLYDDSLKIATAEKNVLILKGLLKAECKTATYNLETHKARLREDPWIYYDIHELTGDSVDLFFTEQEVLYGVSVMRNGKGYHRDVTEKDTIFTEVTGDSIYMDIAENGTVEKMWTYRDAVTLYYSSKTRHLVNEGNGKMMVLNFTEGTTGTLTISGNAECVYFLNEEKESGKNEANGDDIVINFRDGKAVFIKLIGGVRGTYFAERKE